MNGIVEKARLVVRTLLSEAPELSDFSQGWMKDKERFGAAKHKANAGEPITFKMNGTPASATVIPGRVMAKTLKAGDKVLATYFNFNAGAEIYEVLGFTDERDNDDVAKFTSGQEMLSSMGVKSFSELEQKDAHVSMVVKDLSDGDSGGFFYVFQGRFCRGSGAEPVTFQKVNVVARTDDDVVPQEVGEAIRDPREANGFDEVSVLQAVSKAIPGSSVEYPGYISINSNGVNLVFGFANGTFGWNDEEGKLSGESEFLPTTDVGTLVQYVKDVIESDAAGKPFTTQGS